VLRQRLPWLFDALALTRGDGCDTCLRKSLARVDLLILGAGDFQSTPAAARPSGDIKDRHDRGSTIVTSQIPVDHWRDIKGDPTIEDAMLDRFVHNAPQTRAR
jgi:DNA replication protein DnaC